MEKNLCNDSHKYGQYIEKENCFIRICMCCKKETIYPKDPSIKQEIQNNQTSKKIIDKLLTNPTEIITSSDTLIDTAAIITDILSYIELTSDEQQKLITILKTFNNLYNQEIKPRQEVIEETIKFISLHFKHEKLEQLGGKSTITIEQNDNFYDQSLKITNSLTPFLEEIYDTKKNHLQAR